MIIAITGVIGQGIGNGLVQTYTNFVPIASVVGQSIGIGIVVQIDTIISVIIAGVIGQSIGI